MIELVQQTFGPYYLYIKFIHVVFATIWAWSTSVAYVWYVKGAWVSWAENPQDDLLKARRNWAFEQFDKGIVLEHIAFPSILVTGPLLFALSGWTLESGWIFAKLAVVLLVFIPLEMFDYWLCHYAGNKNTLRDEGNPEKYERFMQLHWRFLQFATPVVIIFVPTVLFLAIVKPF